MRRISSKRSRMPSLTTSLRWITPSARAAWPSTRLGHDQRRAAAGGDGVDDGADLGGRVTAVVAHPLHHGRRRALADLPAAREVDAGHPGLRGEGHEPGAVASSPAERSRRPYSFLARTTIERPSGVSSARLDSCAASARIDGSAARHRDELGGLAVAERDRAGLVEQQRVHVAGGLDRAPGHGQHVVLHQPVHARDADGRQERTDGGRDQADQQRDEHDDRLLGPGEDREGLQGRGGRQEDDGQAREQDVERDLVGRLLPAGALDEGDHPVDEALARLGGDLRRRCGRRAPWCRR